jgi:predicted dehydrogenase
MVAKYNIPQVFTDYPAMIAQAGLEAIVVGAPDDLHYAMTMQALRAGLHVLCDKPPALTAAQAWEMYQAAEVARAKYMVLFTYRWMPTFYDGYKALQVIDAALEAHRSGNWVTIKDYT